MPCLLNTTNGLERREQKSAPVKIHFCLELHCTVPNILMYISMHILPVYYERMRDLADDSRIHIYLGILYLLGTLTIILQ